MSKVKTKKKKSGSHQSGSGGGKMGLRGGLPEMLKRAHRIQERLENLKREMKDETWTVDAAGGKIKATINGEKEITKIEIDPDLISKEDVAILEDAVVSVVNAAITTADDHLNAATEEITKGMKIPGLF